MLKNTLLSISSLMFSHSFMFCFIIFNLFEIKCIIHKEDIFNITSFNFKQIYDIKIVVNT
jgi:hypothetical protein